MAIAVLHRSNMYRAYYCISEVVFRNCSSGQRIIKSHGFQGALLWIQAEPKRCPELFSQIERCLEKIYSHLYYASPVPILFEPKSSLPTPLSPSHKYCFYSDCYVFSLVNVYALTRIVQVDEHMD